MNKLLTLFFLTILLTACSNKELYQAGQGHQQSKCINEAQTAEQHNECLNDKRNSYEEYEKERQTVLNK